MVGFKVHNMRDGGESLGSASDSKGSSLFLLVSQSNVEVSDCYATTSELILRLELFLFHYYFNKTLGRYTSLNVSSLPL